MVDVVSGSAYAESERPVVDEQDETAVADDVVLHAWERVAMSKPRPLSAEERARVIAEIDAEHNDPEFRREYDRELEEDVRTGRLTGPLADEVCHRKGWDPNDFSRRSWR